MRAGSWNSQHSIAGEVILDVGSEFAGAFEEKDIVLIGSGERVVVEVINGD